MRSIDSLLWLRKWLIAVRRPLMRHFRGVDLPPSASVSFSASFRVAPGGPITVGEHTLVAFKVLVMGHDPASGRRGAVAIGRNCFVGGNSVILPGVRIGDGSIIGASSVVVEDVPAGSIVVGNPARVVRRDIVVGSRGRLPGADETARAARRRYQERRTAPQPFTGPQE